jgi:general secretion pathway protein L
MRIDLIIKRWLEVLAALLLAWREHQRAQHSLTISEENGQLAVREGGPDASAQRKPRMISADKAAPRAVARAADDAFVIYELAADKVVTRRINVPTQAREYLPGIVRNQIERLSPWPADQVMYGFAAGANSEDGASLDVRVLMTSRAIIDSVRDALASIGLRLDRVVARLSDAGTGEAATGPVALWSQVADDSRESLASTTRLIGIGVAVAIGLSVVLSAFALTSASSIRGDSEELAARSRTLQRQLQGGWTPASMASLPPPQRAWVAKETSPASVIVIEALARALPDAAHLSEIRLEGATLRIIGLANDAPALLAPLEQSEHLTNVRFFAPTTRGPDGRLFRFHIEARVEPRTRIEDE